MAGNKALEKFKNSKIPKKGKAVVKDEVPIYAEPNTHSKIIGTIKKDEMFNWISKSICDGKELVRCDGKNNFGYVVVNDMEGNCNLNMNSVEEKKEEKLNNNNSNSIINEVELTKEEQEYANNALNEILLDDEDEKKDESKSDNFSKSTDFGNISSHSDIISKSEDYSNKVYGLDDDNNCKDAQVVFESKEDDNYDNYFDPDLSNFDKMQKEYDLLFNNLVESIEKDKEKEINYLNAINDIFPGQKNLPTLELLLENLDSIPGGKKAKKDDEIIDKLKTINNVNDRIDDIGKIMEDVKGSFRITNGKKNGDKFSFKYYKSGWKGGSRAMIKTYDVEKIGNNLRKIAKPIKSLKLDKAIDKYLDIKEVVDAYKEDGNKFGTKTKMCLCKKAGEKTGAVVGAAIGTAILGPIGGIIGDFIGSTLGGSIFEKIGEFFCQNNNESVKNTEENLKESNYIMNN